MINKVIAGAFAVVIGGMAVKVIQVMKDNKQNEVKEIKMKDELQD